tara:strand:+ start:1007 stop:1633 length:627 start_codon:yes stop_codon:yes gene_type:complete
MKNTFLFFLLIVITFAFAVLYKQLLDFDELLINSLAERITSNQIEEFLSFQKKWQWLYYFILPLLLFIKISIIALILDVGCFFFDKEIKYKKLFNIVAKAEFVFLGVIILKTIWFYVFQQDYTLENLQYFYPLSALNIVGYEGLQTWFIYPFQVINLFEFAYWFILASLISKELKTTTSKGFSIVASSYGVALLIWVVGVMFFTLNTS